MIHIIQAYFQYIIHAKGRHGIHSPFVYDLVEKVFQPKKKQGEFDAIEQVRKELLHDARVITVTDFGAGSKLTKSNQRKVSQIAKYALKKARFCAVLHRLAHHSQSQTVLELGTSLGVTTAYLAKALKNARIYSLEGCPEIVKIARQNLKKLEVHHVDIITGNFDETLQQVLEKEKTFDFIFIDGNHLKEPTLRYFEQILPYTHDNSIVIFDDIHWSLEMEEAWNSIIKKEALTVTIDVFEMGIVFFRKEQKKQHFIVKC